MIQRERDYVAALCAARAGLNVETEGGYLLEGRLGLVARREGFGSTSELVRVVRERGEERLVWAVVEAMAPSGTAFFRDPQVFDALARDLMGRPVGGAPLRIWSAACGTGQEVHSLAMLLEERRLDGVELFASDLGERALERAKSGLYGAIEVQRGLSARRLVRHFANSDEAFLLAPGLRRRVRWRRMNLLEVPAGAGAFDVILCRYVLGSLLEPARDRVLGHLSQALRPGGQLVLGLDETAPGFAPVEGRPGVFAPIPMETAAAA
ncbi:MAG: methyltransferase domain-containing protein [Phenylobacterium sp.]|nr:MAG: methyltransferase domain-containing protein [Phenylobacterium sp.]